MDDIKSLVLNASEKLNKKIEQRKQVLIRDSVIKLTDKGNAFAKVKSLQSIINQCIQCGNYRRACKYIIFAQCYIDKIIKNEKDAIKKMTDLILR